ncbi:MAG: amino acid ABC transporter substrate-binding protein [Deltaproteobacteria bacterium]|nr:amino acid ABC transporter substrate-binding protein [Deltaproteobacteria bacterium]
MKKSTFKGLLILALAGMVFSGAAAAEEKIYINGIDPNYPPFSFIDSNGKPDGLDIEAINWIAKEMGFKVQHQPTQWTTVIPTLKAGKIDFIASGMSIDEPRKQQVNFSTCYYKTVMVLVAKRVNPIMPDQTMEPDIKWGVQRGSSEANWIQDKLITDKEKKFKLQEYDSAQLALDDIMNGRIDVAAVSQSTAEEFKEKGMDIKILGSYGQPDDETAYACRKEDTEFLKKLNEGLKRLMASSTWTELKTKYNVR